MRANADGDAGRLPALASGLVAAQVDLILAMSNGEARAAMQWRAAGTMRGTRNGAAR